MGLRAHPQRRDAVLAALVFALALAGLLLTQQRAERRYPLSAPRAAAAARADPQVAAFLRGRRDLRARVIPFDERDQRVTFFAGARDVLDVAVADNGRVVSTEEHRLDVPEWGAPLLHRAWMLGLLAGVFLLAVVTVPMRRMRNLDALALAGFAAVVALGDRLLLAASVATGWCLLAYLAARCLRVGAGPADTEAATPLLAALTARWDPRRRRRMLRLATGALLAAGLGITLTSTGMIDVAAASLAGATDLLHGRLPYGQVGVALHGDTYPLLAYVLYVPGALWTPVTDAFSDLTGALLVTALALLAAGAALWRLGGLRAALAWLAFPPVMLAASSGSSDVLLAAAIAWLLVLSAHARRSLLVLAAAVWIKVVPLVLAPLWVARRPLRRAPAELLPALGLSAVLAAALLALGGPGGPGAMVHAVGFQLHRASFHAPWYLFGARSAQPVAQVVVVAAAAWSALRVARDEELRRDPRRLAALCGALLLGVQLAAGYWSWLYLSWAFPALAIGLLPAREAAPVTRTSARRATGRPRAARRRHGRETQRVASPGRR